MTGILVLNTGSSSVKFALYHGSAQLLRGQIRNFPADPILSLGGNDEPYSSVRSISDAVALILDAILQKHPDTEIEAVGHRVVHGGTEFRGPAILDSQAIARIKALTPLAPGHQPSALAGIAAASAALPDALQTASFDTSFHRSQPEHAQLYALPRDVLDLGIRRFGFHGLSYDYLSTEAARHLSQEEPRIVACHLGSGASLCAIRGRKSVATTMGFTALDGLPMATRSGSVDPGVLLYLQEQKGWSAEAVATMLYSRSGLAGLSGVSGNMSDLLGREDEPDVAGAIAYFCHRCRLGIGEMTAVLGGLDGLVFAGGIGENAPVIRTRIAEGLEYLGVEVDAARNSAGDVEVSPDGASVKVLVIDTDEEAIIRRDAAVLLAGR